MQIIRKEFELTKVTAVHNSRDCYGGRAKGGKAFRSFKTRTTAVGLLLSKGSGVTMARATSCSLALSVLGPSTVEEVKRLTMCSFSMFVSLDMGHTSGQKVLRLDKKVLAFRSGR